MTKFSFFGWLEGFSQFSIWVLVKSVEASLDPRVRSWAKFPTWVIQGWIEPEAEKARVLGVCWGLARKTVTCQHWRPRELDWEIKSSVRLLVELEWRGPWEGVMGNSREPHLIVRCLPFWSSAGWLWKRWLKRDRAGETNYTNKHCSLVYNYGLDCLMSF